MITLHDLQEAIAECEGQRNPSSNTCLKLAAFYTIKNQLFPEKVDEVKDKTYEEPVFYSRATSPVAYSSNTEFGKAVANMDFNELLPIIDELMSTLQVLSPKLYNGVMRKLDESY